MKKEKTDYKLWLSLIQTILLLVLVFQIGNLGNVSTGVVQEKSDPAPTRAPSPDAPSPSLDMVKLADDDAFKGDPNAPVTMIEFSDFECPFCGRFYSQTLDQITREYIDTGKVKFVYRDFPLSFHPQAQKSAEAAECAGEQDKFWEMHDLLFERGVSGGVTSFKAFAGEIGLNQAEFDSCLDTGQMASEVAKDMADGQAAGIRGTPGFIINGKLVSGAQPFANFKAIIDAELAR